MKINKIIATGLVKINAYKVITEAVERGVEYGYRRAYKHTNIPDEETIKSNIEQAVMNEICEVCSFND